MCSRGSANAKSGLMPAVWDTAPPELATTVPRPPCPNCGERGIALSISVADEVDVAEALSLALAPQDYPRDWRGRWAAVLDDLERVSAPHDEELSGDNIRAAHQQLQAFFVRTYHIKDALKLEAAYLGVQPQAIEDGINREPDLAVLADLANLDKHFKPDRSPRSGDTPVIGDARGVRAGSGEGGWRLDAPISHHGKLLDGLEVARGAVEAWRRHLQGWGLIQ